MVIMPGLGCERKLQVRASVLSSGTVQGTAAGDQGGQPVAAGDHDGARGAAGRPGSSTVYSTTRTADGFFLRQWSSVATIC